MAITQARLLAYLQTALRRGVPNINLTFGSTLRPLSSLRLPSKSPIDTVTRSFGNSTAGTTSTSTTSALDALDGSFGSLSTTPTVPAPQPLVVVISGPSGVGKDAVIRRLQDKRPDLHFVVTATSRPMRPGETHGIDYFFVSREQFETWIAEEQLLEHAVVY